MFSSVQLLSCVWLFVTPWTAAPQASLSITKSGRLLKLMYLELVLPSNQISSLVVPFTYLKFFSASRSFQMSQFTVSVPASASILPMNIQEWFPLEWTGRISLQSNGLSRVFSNTMVWKNQFFSTQPSLLSNSHIHIRLLGKP